ncbi:hypothetical protein UFOVP116_417 [uncultured Caudovirales phage]|uniref:Uncharacterized protein n=1 Tax=uncultured Caudovirales phage TaxID=2100421 RepID=A0A6J5LBB4_9CAUD|nr:hypothetical protein UFOVP116_417 [uncultured Caudovirales phage]
MTMYNSIVIAICGISDVMCEDVYWGAIRK